MRHRVSVTSRQSMCNTMRGAEVNVYITPANFNSIVATFTPNKTFPHHPSPRSSCYIQVYGKKRHYNL